LTIPAGQFRSASEAGHKVAHDGTIFYPYVGVVEVAGRTTAEVREILTRGLTRYIQNPQVDVRVAGFESQRVHLVGEVQRPRAVPITDVPLTLVQALGLAEGPTAEADLSRVTVTRNGERFTVNVQALQDHGDVSQDMLLRHGDIVHVPDRQQNKVYVLGEVRRPQSLLMHRGRMTLAEAIGDTEGFDMVTSDPSRVFVIREEGEQPAVYWLDASSPDALLLAERFPLRPRDVVFVSTAGITRWSRVINQIAPTLRSLRDIDDVSRR
jgi:polysaccharide export outer membrane protein